jgi:asparagine synthetase B (glutamine-hydrolysing)
MKAKSLRDDFKWKRESSGHYVLWGEYVVEEKEIMAEIKKVNNKWKYCLWTWGTVNPKPLEYSWQTYKTAKEIKSVVIDLVSGGEPEVG